MSNQGPNIDYVVVIDDRHADPVLTVHATRADAWRYVDEHVARTPEARWSEVHPGRRELLVIAELEGPQIRIERHTIRGAP